MGQPGLDSICLFVHFSLGERFSSLCSKGKNLHRKGKVMEFGAGRRRMRGVFAFGALLFAFFVFRGEDSPLSRGGLFFDPCI